LIIDFYKRIEEIRENNDLTKKDFSEKYLNIKNTNYSAVLKGKNINGELSKVLYEKFNINLNWLIGGVGDMYNHDKDLDRPCNLITLARNAISFVLADEKHSPTSKFSVLFGTMTKKSIETYERVSTYYLDEINHPYKVIDAVGLTFPQFLEKFGVKDPVELKKKVYEKNTVWIIKGLSLSKIDNLEDFYNEILILIESAFIEGVSPKGNFIFIDYASYFEKYEELLSSNYVGNLEF